MSVCERDGYYRSSYCLSYYRLLGIGQEIYLTRVIHKTISFLVFLDSESVDAWFVSQNRNLTVFRVYFVFVSLSRA